MKWACDFDVYREWGRAIAQGEFGAAPERKYNVATIYKRAQGQGRIRAIEGLDELQRRHGAHVVMNTLLPVGAMRRNWKQTLVSDGFVMLRHPELQATLSMADEVAEQLRMYAG